jgi:hypothetical protein
VGGVEGQGREMVLHADSVHKVLYFSVPLLN